MPSVAFISLFGLTHGLSLVLVQYLSLYTHCSTLTVEAFTLFWHVFYCLIFLSLARQVMERLLPSSGLSCSSLTLWTEKDWKRQRKNSTVSKIITFTHSHMHSLTYTYITHTHIHTLTHTFTHTHTLTHIHLLTHAHTFTHTHSHTHTHTLTHSHTHTLAYTYTHTFTHTHTHTHIHTLTHTHTHTHTHTCTLLQTRTLTPLISQETHLIGIIIHDLWSLFVILYLSSKASNTQCTCTPPPTSSYGIMTLFSLSGAIVW